MRLPPPRPSKQVNSAHELRDPGAPDVKRYWTVDKYVRLVNASWEARANGILMHAGSERTIEELPPEIIERIRTKSLKEGIKVGLQNLQDMGLLLTEQQYADLEAGRLLAPGDEARYIGPDENEEVFDAVTDNPHTVKRRHGQLGYISVDAKKRKSASGRDLLVFVPHIDPSSGAPVRLVQARLLVAPWEGRYWQLARIP